MSFEYALPAVVLLVAVFAMSAVDWFKSERSSAAAPDGCRPRPYRQHPRRGVAGTARDGDFRYKEEAR